MPAAKKKPKEELSEPQLISLERQLKAMDRQAKGLANSIQQLLDYLMRERQRRNI